MVGGPSSTSGSPYSVRSVLTPAELSDGSFALRNQSFYRPAAAAAAHGLPEQRIPRHIVQTGFTYERALRHHAEWMSSWLELNPEYEYSFFGDEHARRFVEKHGTFRERAAFRRILTGAQRADLFRIIFLKVAGGVYADIDEQLRYPLRNLIGGKDAHGKPVSRSASAVIGTFWPFEFLLYAPRHPFLVHTAQVMTDNILLQVGQQRNGSKHACKTPHECIIRVTGPLAYTSGVGAATHAPGSGCTNRIRTPRAWECAKSSDPMLSSIALCERDEGTIWNSWSCGFARHWDCRNSAKRRKCPAKHYAKTREFFDLRDLGDGAVL